jgi:hypothetical protein
MPAVAVYLHSMFRTGSTYVASRYAQDERYLLFYEPFHADIPSPRRLANPRKDYENARENLRHEKIAGGYFSSYSLVDPHTGRKLHELFRYRFPVHDVMNDLSAAGAEYLSACLRVAKDAGRSAVFGFCRSGLQVASMRRTLPGEHIYLYRDPRYQFASYQPTSNDFFIPQTLLHLLASRRLASIALELARLPVPLPLFVRTASLIVPPRPVAKLGRALGRRLSLEVRYAIFYLSWLSCVEHGRANCTFSFSLMDAVNSTARKKAIEEKLGVDLTGLRELDRPGNLLTVDYAAVESRVEKLVLDLKGQLASM